MKNLLLATLAFFCANSMIFSQMGVYGPNQICPGLETFYETDVLPVNGNFTWTAPPGASISGAGNTVITQQFAVLIAFGAAGGQVCVQGEDGNGNPLTVCKTVAVQPIPPTTLPPVVVCHHDLPYICAWGQEVNTSGFYQTTLTSSMGCDSVVRQQVTVRPPIVVQLAPRYLCPGECTFVGGEKFCNAGNFQVVLTSWQGCDSLVNFAVVKIPFGPITPANPTLSCVNGAVTLSAGQANSNTNYAWFNQSWTQLGASPNLTVTQPGVYHVVVNQALGGVSCKDTLSTTVTGIMTGSPVMITGNHPLSCNRTRDTLVATTTLPGVTYAWGSPNGFVLAGPTAVVTMAGTYFVTATWVNGCTSVGTALVTGNFTQPLVVAGKDTAVTCKTPKGVRLSTLGSTPTSPGSTLQITWTGPGIDLYNTFSSQPVVTVPGVYILKIKDSSNGCSGTDTVFVARGPGLPVADAGPDGSLDSLGATFTLDASNSSGGGNFQYFWSGPDIKPANANDLNPEVGIAGSYALSVRDLTTGCTARDRAVVLKNYQRAEIIEFGIERNSFSIKNPLISPNPASERVSVRYPENWLGKRSALRVFRADGSLFFEKMLDETPADFEILFAEKLAPGLYPVILTNEEGAVFTTKILGVF